MQSARRPRSGNVLLREQRDDMRVLQPGQGEVFLLVVGDDFEDDQPIGQAGLGARYVLPEAPRPSSARRWNGPRSSPTSGRIAARASGRNMRSQPAETRARRSTGETGSRPRPWRRPRPRRGGGRFPRRSAGRRLGRQIGVFGQRIFGGEIRSPRAQAAAIA